MIRISAYYCAEHQADVSLYQTRVKPQRFSVVYGKQRTDNLDYAAAAKEFGECVMHSATCAGTIKGG